MHLCATRLKSLRVPCPPTYSPTDLPTGLLCVPSLLAPCYIWVIDRWLSDLASAPSSAATPAAAQDSDVLGGGRTEGVTESLVSDRRRMIVRRLSDYPASVKVGLSGIRGVRQSKGPEDFRRPGHGKATNNLLVFFKVLCCGV